MLLNLINLLSLIFVFLIEKYCIMSVKEVEEIRQKVFYIDRYVTPFLNNQIMQINANISQLINKVEELDKKVNSLTSNNVSNDSGTNGNSSTDGNSSTIINDNKDKIPKRSSNNDIRTISLQ
jgi:hypothetical protein